MISWSPVVPERAAANPGAPLQGGGHWPRGSPRHLGDALAPGVCLHYPRPVNGWANGHGHQSYPMRRLRAQRFQPCSLPVTSGKLLDLPGCGFPVCKTGTTVCPLQGFIVRSGKGDGIALCRAPDRTWSGFQGRGGCLSRWHLKCQVRLRAVTRAHLLAKH